MDRIYPETLLYCALWASLAVTSALLFGWRVGMAYSFGLFLLIMPSSAIILSRTGSFTLERRVRWSILAVGALVLGVAALASDAR